jgi:hypothetical protein
LPILKVHKIFYTLSTAELVITIKKENSNVNAMIDGLYQKKIINNNDEIIIRKFHDRRNLNPVSHPNGAKPILKETIDEFSEKIFSIMSKIILSKSN